MLASIIAQATSQPSTQFWFSVPKSPAELAAWSLGIIAAGAVVYKLTSGAADGLLDWIFDRKAKLRDREFTELLAQRDRDKKLADLELEERLAQIERDAKIRDAQLAKATLEQADPATPPASLTPSTAAELTNIASNQEARP